MVNLCNLKNLPDTILPIMGYGIMRYPKLTRTLEVKLSEGPSIYAHAEMDEPAWKLFLSLHCTRLGECYYLNSLVKGNGLINTNPIAIVTAFNRLESRYG